MDSRSYWITRWYITYKVRWNVLKKIIFRRYFYFRVIINVLRQGSKACVVKRKFTQAGILISQALTLADEEYAHSRNAQHADILMDKGFFLLNFDSIQESVQAYVMGLETHKSIFEKNNIHVAVGLEDLAYAHYVNEYSSGDFYSARYVLNRYICVSFARLWNLSVAL